MKLTILLSCLMILASSEIYGQFYRHKSEAKIAQMTPSQRVDCYANEQAYHKYDVLDEHSEVIKKYLRIDGLKALPRMIQIIDEYDPTRAAGKRGHKGERFDGARMLLEDLDDRIVRLRGSEEGRRAIEALERSVQRMRAANYGRPEQQEWEEHGRFESVEDAIKYAKEFDLADEAIRDTFRLEYKIILTDDQLLEFSNFLIAHYPEYPGWSDTNLFQDYTKLNYAGNPFWIRTMKKPERYHEAYMEFKSN